MNVWPGGIREGARLRAPRERVETKNVFSFQGSNSLLGSVNPDREDAIPPGVGS